MRTPATSLIAIVTALAGTVTAVPTPVTDGVARRSFPSGGVTCYYQCPFINGLSFTGGAAGDPFQQYISSAAYTCNYLDSSDQRTTVACVYDSSMGSNDYAYSEGPKQNIDVELCPQQITNYVCGSQPESNAYFKRDFQSTASVRQRTPAEEAIHKRQFRPATAAVKEQKRDEEEVEQLA